ncbi:ABC transporter family protein [Spironucleus salmonicida]|uniref:ABC transporter family protein n=1 Tax=Spironucleus salmonicida TaxID=348837 RepID=V6LNA3_9EUKA|nr:ABC transporter family protein [Spironucleus salmonicida]|eukprot:EST45708.1 ABC transporter family protein [Spironucleus salmonicida]
MVHALTFFYLFTLKRSLIHIGFILLVPGALIAMLTYALSFLNDPSFITSTKPFKYQRPQLFDTFSGKILSISPVNDVNKQLCIYLQESFDVSCVNEAKPDLMVYQKGSFQKLAESLKQDIPNFDVQSFVSTYESQYITFFNYNTDTNKVLPLYQINIDLKQQSVIYNVSINDNVITNAHRTAPQSPAIDLTDFDGALYFSTFGTFLQHKLDSFFAQKLAPGVDKFEITILPSSSVFKQKNWQITFFALFGSQSFSFVLLGVILHRFRYCWLVKRVGVNDFRFWISIVFIGFVIMELAFLFQVGFSKLTDTLPYSAYRIDLLATVFIASSFAISAFITFIVVIFERQQQFTIITTAICLSFSIFPVLLSIFGTAPKSLFDNSFIPQTVTYVFVFLCPVLSNQSFTEFLLLMLSNDDLDSQRKYEGPKFTFNQIFSKDRTQKEFPEIFTGKLFKLPPIGFYLVLLTLQGIIYTLLSVYVSYIKKESKSFGLPWNFLFKKEFWQSYSIIKDKSIVLQIEGISKRYKKKHALSNLHLKIQQDSIYGVIGATGAGKTTLLNILAGFQDFDKNIGTQYNLFGNDMNNPYIRLKMLSKIAICPQDKINMFSLLSIQENIIIFQRLNNIEQQSIDEFLELLNLNQALHKTFYQLSGGMQRRFALLCSLMQSPEILMLDEMTANVDPLLKRNIWDTIHKYYETHKISIILTSHDSNDINNIADYVAFLENGTVLKQGLLHQFVQDAPGMKLIINYHPQDFIQILDDNHIIYFLNWNGKQSELFIDIQSNEQFTKIIGLFDQFPNEQYSIVSYPINEVLYNSYQDKVNIDETANSKDNVIIVNETKLLKTFSYIYSAILTKFYEGKASKFAIFLISSGVILFFSILQLFIMKSVRQTQVDFSEQYAGLARSQSFQIFKSVCQLQDTDVEQKVFECLTNQRSSFMNYQALQPPQVGYFSSPQRYLDIIQFDNLQDYSFSFGQNSYFLSDYGTNYHFIIINKDSQLSVQQQIPQQIKQISKTGQYKILQNKFEYSKIQSDITNLKLSDTNNIENFFSQRLINTTADKLLYKSDIILLNDSMVAVNSFVDLQNNNMHNITLNTLSQQQQIIYEAKAVLGIVDPYKKQIILPQPGFSVEKFYVNTKQIFKDKQMPQMQYFRHNSPIFDGPWFIDMDPVYSVQYNNDIITKTYEALVRQSLKDSINDEVKLYNDVFIQGNWNSMPKFVENTVQRPDYATQNSNAYFTFMYFAPWIQCLLSIIALQQIHKVLDQFKLAFINGISISIFVFILSKLVIEILVYSIKIYILFLVMWMVQPAQAYTVLILWYFPLLYSISTISFLYFIELLLSNYSISCLYVGICTVIVVLVNPIMQPTLLISLLISLFVPGFYYIVAARMNALEQSYPSYYLFFGILVSFGQFFLLLIIKYLTTIKNSLKVKKVNDENLVLTANNINAYYNKKAQILTDFNLQIGRSQTTCLVGANGCGKSTFTKCLTGYQVQFTGNIQISSKLGIVPQDDAFDPQLTVYQNLQIYSVFSGRDVKQLMKSCGLLQYQNVISGSLSAGTSRILTIACVMITNPKLLILDEVTVGLDFSMKKQVWQAILNQDCSCIIITHDMLEIEALGNQICIMQGGKIINSDSLQNTLKEADSGYVLSIFQEIEDQEATKMKNQAIKYFDSQKTLHDVLQYLESNQITYGNWYLEKISMESVFLHIIGKQK